MALSDALNKLKTAVGDLASIEVQTYVGPIDVFIKEKKDSTSFEDTLKKAQQNGKLTLCLVTKLNFDGDGLVLIPENPPPDHIQQAHDAALKSGNDIRQGLISLFADVIGMTVKK